MRAHGAFSVLVSGGFTAFTEKIAAMIGFDDHVANALGVAGGRLTGRVEEPILGRAAKREILEAFCRKLDISAEETLAVGDGANDLDMLEGAGLGVAFHAKPRGRGGSASPHRSLRPHRPALRTRLPAR